MDVTRRQEAFLLKLADVDLTFEFGTFDAAFGTHKNSFSSAPPPGEVWRGMGLGQTPSE